MTAPIVDPMAAFYAAVTAVENGQVAEIEVEYRQTEGEAESVLTMTIRRQVKHYSMTGDVGE